MRCYAVVQYTSWYMRMVLLYFVFLRMSYESPWIYVLVFTITRLLFRWHLYDCKIVLIICSESRIKSKQNIFTFDCPQPKPISFSRSLNIWVVPLSIFYGIILVVIGLVATICQEMRQLHVGGISSSFVAVSCQSKGNVCIIDSFVKGVHRSGP